MKDSIPELVHTGTNVGDGSRFIAIRVHGGGTCEICVRPGCAADQLFLLGTRRGADGIAQEWVDQIKHCHSFAINDCNVIGNKYGSTSVVLTVPEHLAKSDQSFDICAFLSNLCSFLRKREEIKL